MMMAHAEEIQGFKVGWPVEDYFKLMAEEGDLSALLDRVDDKDVVDYVCGIAYASDPLSPGGSEWFTLKVDKQKCPNDVLFSMAGMLVNTNDGFVGINSMTMDKDGSMMVYPPAYDAGTEENNELCSHIPGPACEGTSGNKQAGPGEGYVHIHSGFHGVGKDLSEAGYDWRNPVAEVLFGKPTWVNK
ncbi:unnamed protein product [Laminaria digitata]